MKVIQHRALLAAGLILICGVTQAQQGICVYKDSHYDGPRRCFKQDVRDFGELGIDDQISSFQIHGNVEIIFYEYRNYRGAKQQFPAAEATLSDGMNDNFSSMRIIKNRQVLQWGDRGKWGYRVDPDSDWDDDDDNQIEDGQGSACLYPDKNFRGQEFCFTHDDPRFETFGFDNKADSLRIEGNIEVELYQHADYKGFSRVFRKNISQFRADEHDQYSAIRIRKRRKDDGNTDQLGQPDDGNNDQLGQACLFPDWNYVGQPYCFSSDMPRFAEFGFDNKADSIRLEGNIEVILYQHENYTGYSRVFRNNMSQFHGKDHDQYSSIRIRPR